MELEDILKQLNWEVKGINANKKFLNHFKHADFVVLVVKYVPELQIIIEGLRRRSEKAGLNMNTDKTKIMTNRRENININVKNDILEQAEEYIWYIWANDSN